MERDAGADQNGTDSVHLGENKKQHPRTSRKQTFLDETRSLTRLAWPVVATQLAHIALTTTDVIMAGRLSDKDLASIAVGNSIGNPIIYTTMGVLNAITPIVAQLFGAEQRGAIGQKVSQGLWAALALSIPGFLLMWSSGPLMVWMDLDPTVIPTGRGYLRALAWGLPFYMGFFVLRFFNEGLSLTRPAFIVALLAIPVNIVGDYVFMYGAYGFPKLGAVGSGYATALVWLFQFLALAAWSFYHRQYAEYQLLPIRRPHLPDIREILRIGLPNGGSIFLEISMFAVVTLLIGALGVTMVAAHMVAINIASILYMIPLGIGIAMTSRVGQAMGRGDLDEVKRRGFTGIGLCFLITLGLALFLLVGAPFFAGLYTQDPEVLTLATELLFFAALFQVSDGLQVASIGALRGLKDTMVPFLTNIVAFWVIGLPVGIGVGLGLAWGVRGFWIGLVAGLSAGAIFQNLRFFILTRKDAVAPPR